MSHNDVGLIAGDELRGGLVAWFAAALGTACLLAASAVAGYAVVRANSPYCATTACRDIGVHTTVLGWVVVAAGLIAPAAAAGLWRSGSRSRFLRPAALLCAAALGIAYLLTGLAIGDAPSGQRTWLIRVATWFAIGGFVILAVAPVLRWRTSNKGAVAVAVTVAVGIVAALGVLGWRDERSTVDATIAAPAPIPPKPAVLGHERFRLTVPYFRPYTDSAGPGFVVWSRYWGADPDVPDVTAFDSSGHERWHYGRTAPDPLRISHLQVYDQGRTVVLGMTDDDNTRLIIGLDATAGTHLWTSTDPDMWNALDVDEGGSHHFFMVRREDHWTAFNARTGRQAWHIPNPATCGPVPLDTLSSLDTPVTVRPVDTDTRLVTVVDCSTSAQISLRVLATDPKTGEQVVAQRVPRVDGAPRSSLSFLAAGAAAGDMVAIELTGPSPSYDLTTMWFDYMTGRAVDYPDARLYSSFQSRGDYLELPAAPITNAAFLDPGDRSRTVTLRDADQSVRCTFDRVSQGNWPPVWLADQLVLQELSRETRRPQLRVINRDDCRTEQRVPLPFPASPTSGMTFVAPVAGATLVQRWHDDATFDIVGYAP